MRSPRARSARTLALLALLALGCAGAPREGGRAPLGSGALSLARTVAGEREVFRRTQSIALLDDGQGAALSMVARSRLEHRPFGDAGQVLEHAVFLGLDLTRDGEEMEPPPNVYGLERLVVRTLLDAQGRPAEGPQRVGRPQTSADVESAALMVLRLLRPILPDGAVRVGERWSPSPIAWDTPPGHRLALELTPTFTLRGVDTEIDGSEVALIDWDAPFRVLPFAAIAGTTLEGTGQVRGTSRVRVADGLAVRTELDLELSVGPSGAAALVGLFRFDAKYVDVLEPVAAPGPRELVSGVLPVDPTEAPPAAAER